MILQAAHPRPAFNIADIARLHRKALEAKHTLTLQQKRLLGAMVLCRTPALGGQVFWCEACQAEHNVWHSCRRRGCPICQAADQERWIQARAKRILPVKHFHVTFTLPSELRTLAKIHPVELYNTLFRCVGDILEELGRTHAGAIYGWTMILHTWTRDLRDHPHIHALVTAGGLSMDGNRFIPSSENYLFSVEVMGELLRGKFMEALGRLFKKGAFPELDESDFLAITKELGNHKRWIVYAQKPFAKVDHLLQYLGRYTHRVGISNSRLVNVTNEAVTFTTKEGRTATLHPVEFLWRFLQHVLPDRFHKIRHGGLYADARPGGKLDRARALIQEEQPSKKTEDSRTTEDNGAKESPHNPSPNAEYRCPICNATMSFVGIRPRMRSPPEAA